MKTQVDAKVTIKGEQKSFNLTLDWDGLSEDEMRALAQRSIVIAWQNEHRTANKGEGSWPSENPTVKATDYRIGHTRAPVDPVKLIEAGQFTKEQLEAFAAIIRNKMRAQG